jgi:hypothetical protein
MSISLYLLGSVVLFLAGGITGYTVADKQSDVAEQHTHQLRQLQQGQADLAAEVSKPIVLDAELRSELGKTPPACVTALGGDPLSPQCLLQTCWQYGQSSAQRPDCDGAEKLVVDTLSETAINL